MRIVKSIGLGIVAILVLALVISTIATGIFYVFTAFSLEIAGAILTIAVIAVVSEIVLFRNYNKSRDDSRTRKDEAAEYAARKACRIPLWFLIGIPYMLVWLALVIIEAFRSLRAGKRVGCAFGNVVSVITLPFQGIWALLVAAKKILV